MIPSEKHLLISSLLSRLHGAGIKTTTEPTDDPEQGDISFFLNERYEFAICDDGKIVVYNYNRCYVYFTDIVITNCNILFYSSDMFMFSIPRR